MNSQDSSQTNTYEENYIRLNIKFLVLQSFMFSIFAIYSGIIISRYKDSLSKQSKVLVWSFWCCLITKLIVQGVTSAIIGNDPINNKKDDLIYNIVVVSMYPLDIYLYLIFSVTILNMVKILAFIKYSGNQSVLAA